MATLVTQSGPCFPPRQTCLSCPRYAWAPACGCVRSPPPVSENCSVRLVDSCLVYATPSLISYHLIIVTTASSISVPDQWKDSWSGHFLVYSPSPPLP